MTCMHREWLGLVCPLNLMTPIGIIPIGTMPSGVMKRFARAFFRILWEASLA